MVMTSDAIELFFGDPTFANLFRAAPTLFGRALFDFFAFLSKVHGVGSCCLVWGLFLAIHAIAYVLGLLLLVYVVELSIFILGEACPPFKRLMDRYGWRVVLVLGYGSSISVGIGVVGKEDDRAARLAEWVGWSSQADGDEHVKVNGDATFGGTMFPVRCGYRRCLPWGSASVLGFYYACWD